MDENTLISVAIKASQRSRWRTLLANPKKRKFILDKLNHVPPLDERFTKWYKSLTKALKDIDIDPAVSVYLLSAANELDGRCMAFKDAINLVPEFGWGTIIGINPSLAIYYGECGENVAIIHKPEN